MMLAVLVLVLLLPSALHAACSGAGLTWTCTAGTTSTQVASTISSGTDGMTLTFDAGSYTWNATQIAFPLTKSVTLICASQNACNVSLGGAMIGFPTGTSSKLYRISGFNFTITSSLPIWGCSGGGCSATLLSNVRIDHNTFNDTSTAQDRTIIFFGENTSTDYYVEGVIDHNTVNCTNSCYFLQVINDTNTPTSRKLGSIHNLFVEDNTITITTMTNNGTGCVDGWGGHGVVARFNTVYNCRMLMHGTGAGHAWGPINFEVYGNSITMNNSDSFIKDCTRCIHHQGSGTQMYFKNVFAQSPGQAHSGDPIVTLHYRSDTIPNSGSALCDGNDVLDGDGNRSPIGTYAGYPCFRQPGRDIDGRLFPIFAWENRWSDDGAKALFVCNGNAPTCTKHVVADRDRYDAVSNAAQSSSSSPFNGTTGMGFGTLANRPTTCTTNSESADAGNGGVGYWATDEGDWRTDNGATKDGQLYMCTATNTWTLYYTPYTYPHPLVSGGGGGSSSGSHPTGGVKMSPMINLRRGS